MPFSQIIPPSSSPTESIRLFYTFVSLLLSHIQGYCYHLSKFHIYVLVYCIDVFLEHSCFFYDPEDVGNLMCVSSAFSKTSLNIMKFTVHVLLKPGLENFEHYFQAVYCHPAYLTYMQSTS